MKEYFQEIVNQTKQNKFFLLVIPALYFVIANYFQQMTGLYSLRSIDPEYIYFISGLSVANGELELGHIDNPGTPLQFLLAIIFRVIYLFRSGNVPLIEDALANADLYLATSNLVIIFIVTLILLFAGIKVFRISQKLSYGVLIQTIPFYTGIFYGNVGRVTPENILPVPVVILSVLLLLLIRNQLKPESKKTAFLMAFTMALGLSIKLTFFPLLIIPFIVISTWKNKGVYVLTTIVSFFAFALPATLQINTFWHWVKALFFKSGQYGTGKDTIIDIHTIGPNLSKLLNQNEVFVLVLACFSILALLVFISDRKRTFNIQIRIALALILASVLQILLVSKHFEQRYFVNALFLIPLMIICGLELTKRWHVHLKYLSVSAVVSFVFLLSFAKTQVKPIQQLSVHLEKEQQKRMPAYHYFKGLEEDAIKIFVPGYYNCPSPEYALRFSYGWAGKQKELYKPYLTKLFPNTIIFYFWDGTFNVWGETPDLNQSGREIYVYSEHYKHFDLIQKELNKHIESQFDLIEDFRNEASNEVIYKLQVKTESEED